MTTESTAESLTATETNTEIYLRRISFWAKYWSVIGIFLVGEHYAQQTGAQIALVIFTLFMFLRERKNGLIARMFGG